MTKDNFINNFQQNHCLFCFEPISTQEPDLNCAHKIGETMDGLQLSPLGWISDGKYRIGMTLGQGEFGIINLANDKNLQQKIDIKDLIPRGLGKDNSQFIPPYTQKSHGLFSKAEIVFYRGRQILARFRSNPGFMNIYNFFHKNKSTYFVIEYVEGKSLAAYLEEKGGSLSQAETISLLSPIMDALDSLHQDGIIHRDITPEHIYLTKSDRVKILDFCTAKDELSHHTHSSAEISESGYAPEQYSQTGKQGPWTDIYAMGAIFYRCLTGIMPPNAPDRITGSEISPISTKCAEISKNVEEAVMKALALNISDRWQQMSDFKNALFDQKARIDAQKS